MSNSKTIKSALISVFHKDGLAPIVKKLNELNVTIYSILNIFHVNSSIQYILLEELKNL